MSDHTVTENLVQRNAVTTATLTCSCGKSVEGSLRRKPLRALRVELARLHEVKKPEPVANEHGDDDFATPVVETEPVKDTEPEQDLDEDWPDEGGAKS